MGDFHRVLLVFEPFVHRVDHQSVDSNDVELQYSVKNLVIAFIYKILLFSYTKGKSGEEEVYF
jgi:hypothetical protein